MDNYKDDNAYITEYLKGLSPPEKETNAMQEPMEEEIAERNSLDENEEESEEQKEDLPSKESNSLTLTLYDMQQLPWLKKDKNKLSNAFPTVICDELNDTPLSIPPIDIYDNKKHILCDSYIVEFVNNATENYYERGKYGCWSSHATKVPLFMLKVLKLLSFYLSMLNTLCFIDLFAYNMPMHRKWFRLKCVWYF